MHVIDSDLALKISGAWKFSKDMVNGEVGFTTPWSISHEDGSYYITPYALMFKSKMGTVKNKVEKQQDRYFVDTDGANKGIEINFSDPVQNKNEFIPCTPITP